MGWTRAFVVYVRMYSSIPQVDMTFEQQWMLNGRTAVGVLSDSTNISLQEYTYLLGIPWLSRFCACTVIVRVLYN